MPTEDGGFSKPSDVFIRPSGFDDLFSGEEVHRTLGKKFLHRTVSVVDGKQLYHTEELCSRDAVAILVSESFEESLAKKSIEWLGTIYSFFTSRKKELINNSALVQQLFQPKVCFMESFQCLNFLDVPGY